MNNANAIETSEETWEETIDRWQEELGKIADEMHSKGSNAIFVFDVEDQLDPDFKSGSICYHAVKRGSYVTQIGLLELTKAYLLSAD